jgi:hypothetical protein
MREAAIRHFLNDIWDEYRTLSDRSEDVRYRGHEFAVEQARSFIDTELRAIKEVVQRLLGS